jgi:hypothetical protein
MNHEGLVPPTEMTVKLVHCSRAADAHIERHTVMNRLAPRGPLNAVSRTLLALYLDTLIVAVPRIAP